MANDSEGKSMNKQGNTIEAEREAWVRLREAAQAMLAAIDRTPLQTSVWGDWLMDAEHALRAALEATKP